MQREYNIPLHKLAWMDRIKPMSEAETYQLTAYAREYPEKLIGKTIVVAVLDEVNSEIVYHFTPITSVIRADDTVIDNKSGKEADNEGDYVLFGIQLAKLGPQLVKLWMDQEFLVKTINVLNDPKNTEKVEEDDGNIYFYRLLNPPRIRARAKRKSAKKLNSKKPLRETSPRSDRFHKQRPRGVLACSRLP